MIKKILLLFIVYPVLALFNQACICTMDKPEEISIEELDVYTDKIMTHLQLDTTQFTAYDSIAKVIEITQSQFVLRSPSSKPVSFISGAYACDDIENFAEQTLSAVRLVSTMDASVNEEVEIAVGDTLSDYFQMSFCGDSGPYASIDEMIAGQHQLRERDRFYLRFDREPENETRLEFDLHIKLSDGKTFVFNDEILKIK
jgi:hypothetical protein